MHFRQLIGRPFPFLEFLPLMLMSTAVCPFSSCSCMASSISSVTSKPFCCIHSLLPISTLYLVGSLAALLPSFAWLSAVEGEQFPNHDMFPKKIINASETTRIQAGKELASEEKVKIRTNGYKATMYLMLFTPAVILIN